MPFILLMLLINIPVGYLICRYFKIHKFWKILLVGLGQYAACSMILAALMIYSDNSPANFDKFGNALKLGGAGMLVFAIFSVPLILLYAWLLTWWFGRKKA